MSLYEQEKIIFKRFADSNNGKYITAATVALLLGTDALQYATNAADQNKHPGKDKNIVGLDDVFTFNGFSKAFDFFRMMEIKEGLYNAYETPNYLDRGSFREQ